MGKLNEVLVRWQRELTVGFTSQLFVRIVYLIVLWSMLKLLPIGNWVWGDDFFILLSDPFLGPDRFAMLLNVPAVRSYYLLFALPFIALLIAGVAGFHNFFTRIAVWFLFVNLHFGNGAISTGGHHLIQQLLFFHIFLFSVNSSSHGYFASLRRFVHHLSHYAIWAQIAVLYLVSGVWKLKGDLWLDGTAMQMTMSFKEFGFPWIADSIGANNWMLMMLTWMVLGYQLLFAVLIWIRPVRKWLLVFGMLFHLSIIFIVGITDFGLFMIASYSIFIPNKVAQRYASTMNLKAWKARLT